MESKSSMVVDLNDIHFSYPESKPLIQGFDLKLKEGEWLSIIGRSGIGKTTLLKLICHELEPNSGTLYTEELPAYLTQRPLLLPWLDVRENVAFSENLHTPFFYSRRKKHSMKNDTTDDATDDMTDNEQSKRLNELLRELNLTEAQKKLPNQLSGGMAQRVAIGRTLSLRRRLWVLDEPFSQLDALTRRELHLMVKRIAQENQITVVLVTHDVEEAVQLSDSVICLQEIPVTTLSTPRVEIERDTLSPREFEFSLLKQEQVKKLIQQLEGV